MGKRKNIFNLRHAFISADRFAKAASLMSERLSRTNDTDVIDPFIVLGALSLEIYLKCIYFIETGKTDREHDLKKLYDKLSDNSRREIRRVYNKLIYQNPLAKQTKETMRRIENVEISFDFVILQIKLTQKRHFYSE